MFELREPLRVVDVRFELVRLDSVPIHSDFYIPHLFVQCIRTNKSASSGLIACAFCCQLDLEFYMRKDSLIYVKKVDYGVVQELF